MAWELGKEALRNTRFSPHTYVIGSWKVAAWGLASRLPPQPRGLRSAEQATKVPKVPEVRGRSQEWSKDDSAACICLVCSVRGRAGSLAPS